MMKRISATMAAVAALTLLGSASAPAATPVDRDGAVVVAQATKAAPKRTRRPPADVTRQQYIDRAAKAAERRFDAMDTNKDGKLTAQERQDYAKKRREARDRRKKGK